MSYLRQLAVGHRPRPRPTRCLSCGHLIYPFERHCPWCGHRNRDFNAGLFRRIAKMSVFSALRPCTAGTSHAIETAAYTTDPDLRQLAGRTAHCHLCGAPLTLISLGS
jgi:hypothetical protein